MDPSARQLYNSISSFCCGFSISCDIFCDVRFLRLAVNHALRLWLLLRHVVLVLVVVPIVLVTLVVLVTFSVGCCYACRSCCNGGWGWCVEHRPAGQESAA